MADPKPIEPNDDDIASAEKAMAVIRGYGVTLGRDHFMCQLFACQRIEGNTERFEVVHGR